MNALQSCMGGRCARREQCGHYHAATETQEPAERLCTRGLDGDQQKESADMTRIRFSTEARVEQVQALLKPEGTTTRQIADALGIKTAARTSIILAAAGRAGVAFRTFARVSDEFKTPEQVYFPTAADRDAFRAAYDAKMIARRKEREATRGRAKYERRRDVERAVRAALREEAKELREANAIAARLQREAERSKQAAERLNRISERERAKLRARLDREAAAAAKAREKAEALKTKQRLKAETRAAGLLAKPKAGAVAAPVVVKPKGPAFLSGPADESQAKRISLPTPPGRFAVTEAPSVISSRECRKWAEEVAA